MDRLPDSVPLDDFQENATAHLRKLSKSRRPARLVRGGKTAAVVMSPETFDRLSEAAELSLSIRKVRTALKEFEAGKGRPAKDVMGELRAKYARRPRRGN